MYFVYPGLVSCIFLYTLSNIIYEIFHLLVIIVLTQALFLHNNYNMLLDDLELTTERVGNGKKTMMLGFT